MADNKNLEKKEVAKKKSDKPNLWEKVKKFFREYKSELKKISWPTLPEVVKNSLVTIVVVLIVGLFIWVVDSVLTLGRDAVLGLNTTSTEQTTDDDTSDLSESVLNAINEYGLESVAVSAADVISGADASASDVYVITSRGELIDGYEKYIASNEADAATYLINYALTLDLTETSETDVVSSADTASASDAE